MKKTLWKKRFRLNLLILAGLVLSLLLSARGGGSNFTPAPQATATTAASTTSAAPTTAAPQTSAPLPTAEPTSGPVGAATVPAGSPAPVAVIDPNLKGDLLVWEALPERQTAMARDLAATFGKAYPGVKITSLHFDPTELVYAVEEAARGGKLPDLILASSDFLTDFNGVKAIQPADKLFDKAFLDSFVAGALSGTQVGGTQWGVPFTYSGAPVMLYNKKLVPTPPATWKDLGKVVAPLYDPRSRQIGLAIEVNEPYILTSLLGAFDGAVLDGKNQPSLDTPAMVNSLTFIQDLLKDRTVREASRAKDNQIDYAFRDGRLGIYIAGDWLIGQYANALNPTDPDAKLDLGIAPLPVVDKTGKSPAPLYNGKSFFVGAQVGGDRVKLVKTYLEWLSRTEQQATILAKARLLPATKAFLASDAVKKDAAWSGLLKQLELGKPQPAALEMRAVWDALRPSLQDVVAGVTKPADAARQMQQTALDNVARLNVK